MPKIVDHDARRNEIALAACRAIARRGLDSVTLSDIAKEAGRTTGMLAHYYPSKWDLILGALRFMHVRLEQRLSRKLSGDTTLLELLQDALPIGREHRSEAAAWLTFWAAAASKPDLLKISAKTHAEWRGLIERCVMGTNEDAKDWPREVIGHVVTSIILFMDGLYAKAMTCPAVYKPDVQIELMSRHLESVLLWARSRPPASRRR